MGDCASTFKLRIELLKVLFTKFPQFKNKLKAKNNFMNKNTIENISKIIKHSKKMVIIGFVDKTNIVDNLISERLKSVLESLENKIKILEYDAVVIQDNYNFFSVVTIPTYNIYYNNVLLEQFDLMDTIHEIKRKLSFLIIN